MKVLYIVENDVREYFRIFLDVSCEKSEFIEPGAMDKFYEHFIDMRPQVVVVETDCISSQSLKILEWTAENSACCTFVLTDGDGCTGDLDTDVHKVIVNPEYCETIIKQLVNCMLEKGDSKGLKDTFDGLGRVLVYHPDQNAFYINGDKLQLTPKEKGLLRLMKRKEEYTVHYLEIENEVWNGEGMSKGSLKSIVNNMRKKVEPFYTISNVSGEGYVLRKTTDVLPTLPKNKKTKHVIPFKFNLTNKQFDYVGEEIKSCFGCHPKRIRSIPDWLKLVHPEDRHALKQHLLALKTKKHEHYLEYRMQKEDGNYVWVREMAQIVFAGEKPKEVVGFVIPLETCLP
ncbi:MAG: PAS domain-containing protein [Sulfurimonadaceae bacterium]|nr:PAS domain-containing protein [Sulfurimonadaceae bacterium]